MNMKLLLVASSLFLSMGCVGCASRQAAPAMPTSPCDQCYAQVKEGAKDKAALFTVEVANKFITVMKESEEYLSKKLDEWKTSHPEWVQRAQEQLDGLRARIREYEEKAKEKLSSHK